MLALVPANRGAFRPSPVRRRQRRRRHALLTPTEPSENPMLYYAIVFLVIALVAGALGFFAISGTAAWIAKVLFVVFLVLFVISLVRGRRVGV